MMNNRLEYDDCSAALMEGDTCLRAFMWPRDGGCVRELRDHGKSSLVHYDGGYGPSGCRPILSEDEALATARHIADAIGLPHDQIVAR